MTFNSRYPRTPHLRPTIQKGRPTGTIRNTIWRGDEYPPPKLQNLPARRPEPKIPPFRIEEALRRRRPRDQDHGNRIRSIAGSLANRTDYGDAPALFWRTIQEHGNDGIADVGEVIAEFGRNDPKQATRFVDLTKWA